LPSQDSVLSVSCGQVTLRVTAWPVPYPKRIRSAIARGIRPDSACVTQQARNLTITGSLQEKHILLRDRDGKFSGPFDEVFRTEAIAVVKTPVRAPRANAFAERWVGTVRRECLDHMLIFGRRHLQRVLDAYAKHYNGARPHRSIAGHKGDRSF
jgi:hypothetical protein